MFQFKVGDTVEWASQSGGHYKTKTGVVVWVISAGAEAPSVAELAAAEGLEKVAKTRVKFDTEGSRLGRGIPRNEGSYVIRVGKDYYRPMTRWLKKGR